MPPKAKKIAKGKGKGREVEESSESIQEGRDIQVVESSRKEDDEEGDNTKVRSCIFSFQNKLAND